MGSENNFNGLYVYHHFYLKTGVNSYGWSFWYSERDTSSVSLLSGNLTETQNKALKILLNKIADIFESNNVDIQISNLGSPPNCTHFDTKWNFYNSLFFSFTAITTIGKHIFL